MHFNYRQRIRERSVVKADPGWAVAYYVKPGKDQAGEWAGHVGYDPIIAWAITYEEGPYDPHYNRESFHARERWHHRSVEPITFEHGDLTWFGNFWGVKRPDGKIQIPSVALCNDEADFIETAKDEITAKAREAKAAS